MATPVFDSANGTTDGTAGTTITGTSVTPGGGSNRLLLVSLGVGSLSPAPPSGITYNGVALTHVSSASVTRGFWNLDVWYLKEADFPGSAADIVATTGTHDEKALVWAFYKDVDQTTPFRGGAATTSNGNGTAASVTVSSNTDDLVAGTVWIASNNITVNAGTSRFEIDNVFGFEAIGASDVSGASPTLSWTVPSTDWMMSAVSLIGSSGGGAAVLDDSGSFPGFEAQSNPLVISVW